MVTSLRQLRMKVVRVLRLGSCGQTGTGTLRDARHARFEARAGARTALSAAAALSLFAAACGAVELPSAAKLEAETGVGRQTVKVVEPHESRGERRVMVDYLGFPFEALLNHWFGDAWRAPDAELALHAVDGYRSILPSARLQRYRAYLGFGRADGESFVVDNPAQHQAGVPLAPYYLVWDNLSNPELLADGTYGWPYQVTRVELRSAADDRALIPGAASAEVQAGFLATKTHCLTCHRIRGVGGEKYPGALERSVCGWTDRDLSDFIARPEQRRPGTAMPALEGTPDSDARRQTIGRIVTYLNAVKTADSPCP